MNDQRSLFEQISDLVPIANQHGLYDAADLLIEICSEVPVLTALRRHRILHSGRKQTMYDYDIPSDSEWIPCENRQLSVPVSKWAIDHWSTFAYLETRVVDYDGLVDNTRMRCHARLHREFAHYPGGSDYPTRLKHDEELTNHDDWSCVEDMVAAGFVTVEFCQVRYDVMFNNTIARVKLTPLGTIVAEQLRRHKANGGRFQTFTPEA